MAFSKIPEINKSPLLFNLDKSLVISVIKKKKIYLKEKVNWCLKAEFQVAL